LKREKLCEFFPFLVYIAYQVYFKKSISVFLIYENRINMEKNNTTMQIQKPQVVGTLFLLAFLLYGIGRNLFESEVIAEKYIGASLIGLNSIAVVFIGVFLRKTIIKFNMLAGNVYLLSRVVEAIALVSIILNLIPEMSISMDLGYFIAMFVLGLGSIPMCYALYKYMLAPRWLALWGLIGYALLSFGFLMEFFANAWSMYLLVLGGLWELTFAIWLVLKGGKNKIETTKT